MSQKLLEVKHYTAEMQVDDGTLYILQDVNFHVNEDECFGIIGESGCGKTMTSMAILRYGERLGLRPTGGEILFAGEDVLSFSKKRLREYNGKEAVIILQDPMQALDPLYTIEKQLLETVYAREKISKAEAMKKIRVVMKKLSISEEKLKCYPHELSGGMLQRIVGAMVILCKPKLIIADEPTTALDVSIQLQYLKLLKQIQKEYHTSIIFISHDIKVISMMCDRIAVMYGGRIVEQGSAKELFEHPVHPYTRALFRSGNMGGIPHEQYETIEGNPPDLHQKSVGCPFADRCKHARQKCHEEMPELNIFEGGHEAQCHFAVKYEKNG